MGNLFEPATVPVITLWQPYASLCFVPDKGLRKCLETRGYPPPLKHVGGDIAIHSAASHPAAKFIPDTLADLASHAFGSDWRRTLPMGRVLGLVTLSGGIPVEQVRDSLNVAELVAGDYGDGRFAWPLSDPRPLAEPVPAKGKQGWWRISHAALGPISDQPPTPDERDTVARMREALEPFAKLAGPINGEEGRPTYLEAISGPNGTDELLLSTYVGDGTHTEVLDAEDFRRARAALEADRVRP